MTAADHRETVSRREEARRRKCGDRLLAGVDEIEIDLIIIRKGADAEHAVFRLEDDRDVRRHEIRDERRDGVSEIDVATVLEFERRRRCPVFTGPGYEEGSSPPVRVYLNSF